MKKIISLNMVNTRSIKEHKAEQKTMEEPTVPARETNLETPDQSNDGLERKTTESSPMPNAEEQEKKTPERRVVGGFRRFLRQQRSVPILGRRVLGGFRKVLGQQRIVPTLERRVLGGYITVLGPYQSVPRPHRSIPTLERRVLGEYQEILGQY